MALLVRIANRQHVTRDNCSFIMSHHFERIGCLRTAVQSSPLSRLDSRIQRVSLLWLSPSTLVSRYKNATIGSHGRLSIGSSISSHLDLCGCDCSSGSVWSLSFVPETHQSFKLLCLAKSRPKICSSDSLLREWLVYPDITHQAIFVDPTPGRECY